MGLTPTLREQQRRSQELVRRAEVLRRADHLAALAQRVCDVTDNDEELSLLEGAVKAYRQVRRG